MTETLRWLEMVVVLNGGVTAATALVEPGIGCGGEEVVGLVEKKKHMAGYGLGEGMF